MRGLGFKSRMSPEPDFLHHKQLEVQMWMQPRPNQSLHQTTFRGALGHILSAVWTQMCPGPHWETTNSSDTLWNNKKEATMDYILWFTVKWHLQAFICSGQRQVSENSQRHDCNPQTQFNFFNFYTVISLTDKAKQRFFFFFICVRSFQLIYHKK